MRLIRASLLLLIISMLLLGTFTLFESALVAMPRGTERLVTFLALVLPASAGSLLGMMSLIRGERPLWLVITVTILNTLFALSHVMIVLFAG